MEAKRSILIKIPALVGFIGLISLTISPQYVFSEEVFGIGSVSLHKLFVLMALLPYVLFRSLREKVNAPIVAYLIVLFLTFTLSSRHPELEVSEALRAFVGFTLGWLVFSINWDIRVARKSLLILSLIPLISIAVGGVLQLLGFYTLYLFEYGTYALRLQGATIPAHLALLAFMGFGSAFTLVSQGRNWYLLLGLANFAVIVFTGSRGALIASLFILLVYVFGQVRNVFRGRTAPSLVNLSTVFSVAGLSLYFYWANNKGRMTGDQEAIEMMYEPNPSSGSAEGAPSAGGAIQDLWQTYPDPAYLDTALSGRWIAWQTYFDTAMENPWFGRGLGAGTVLDERVVNPFRPVFTVPHNEYLRMFVDGGLVGILIILMALVVVFYRVMRGTRLESRPYLLALLIGFAVYSLTDNTLSTMQFLVPFCWYLGVLCTLDNQGHIVSKESSL